MYYILVILIAYLMGSSNLSYFISKWKGVEMRERGSKNLGASNTMIVLGWKYGILVGIHDIGKSVLAVLLANHFFSELPFIGVLAGVASVMGHIFPFYLKFKGGKGFASYLGMTIALNWKLAIVICILIVLATLITNYIVIGTTLTITIVPIAMGIITHSWIFALILLFATLVIAFKHRKNYVQIAKGTEIGFRSANRGDHRS